MLPENLNSYAKTAAFIEVSSAHKSDAIKAKLDEQGVEYLANDNKTALIYRLLAAEGRLPNLTEEDLADDDDLVDEFEDIQDEPIKEQAPSEDKDDGAVVVESYHYRNLIEPATGTLIPPQGRTKIYPTAHVSRERIVNNLEQIMFLHRDMLKIVGGES